MDKNDIRPENWNSVQYIAAAEARLNCFFSNNKGLANNPNLRSYRVPFDDSAPAAKPKQTSGYLARIIAGSD